MERKEYKRYSREFKLEAVRLAALPFEILTNAKFKVFAVRG
jgi:transposase-like protein